MINRGSMDSAIEWVWLSRTLGDLIMVNRGSMDKVIEWVLPSRTLRHHHG